METPVEKKNIGPYSISQLRIAVTELFCSVDGMSLALHIVFLLCVYNVYYLYILMEVIVISLVFHFLVFFSFADPLLCITSML